MEEGKVCSPNSAGEVWLLVGSEKNVLQDFFGGEFVPWTLPHSKRARKPPPPCFAGKLATFKVMRFQGNCSKVF